MNAFGKRLSETFQELDGSFSFARVSCGLIVLAWLIWVSYVVIKTSSLPQNMWEVSAPVTALYGLNRVSNAIVGTEDKESK
jgi:hypothetical protein